MLNLQKNCVRSYSSRLFDRNSKPSICAAILSLGFLCAPVQAQLKKASEPKNVSITVYQSMAVVREVRELDLEKGTNKVVVEGVAKTLDPSSIVFHPQKNRDRIQIEEQNFKNDVLAPGEILAKWIGKPITVKQFLANGQTPEINGTLVFAQDAQAENCVIKSGDQYILGPKGQLQIGSLPPDMVIVPSIVWNLNSDFSGKENCEITYIANALSWSADYIATVDDLDKNLDLDSWVSIDNQTGTGFKQAKIELIAGEVRSVSRDIAPMPRFARMAMQPLAAAMPMPAPQQEAIEEYHLYSLPKITNLDDKETKQINLFSAEKTPIQKKLIVDSYHPIVIQTTPDGGQLQSVEVSLEFKNDEQSHLGIPLPQGKVSVYKRDREGQLQFIGSDQLRHTPKNETVRLHIGNASDIVVERKQAAFQQVSKQVRKANYEIDLRNHKDKEETITIVEHANGDWKINSSSHPYVKKNSTTFEFAIKVGANSEETLTYEIQTKSK